VAPGVVRQEDVVKRLESLSPWGKLKKHKRKVDALICNTERGVNFYGSSAL
jgi:hypothetical protein